MRDPKAFGVFDPCKEVMLPELGPGAAMLRPRGANASPWCPGLWLELRAVRGPPGARVGATRRQTLLPAALWTRKWEELNV